MTPEERQMLGGLFQRVNAAAATPRDAEAESFINDAVRAAPHAPYVLSQTVLVQQQALEAAANRISQLEAAAQQTAEQSQEHGSFLGNLGKSIFGGAPSAPPRPDPDPQAYQRAPAPPPPRGYAPTQPPGYAPAQSQGYPPPPQGYPPQPGPWGQPQPSSGGGFLQNAASTATGVAGGVVLGNLLGGLFGGHGGGGGLFGGGGVGGAGLGGAGLSGNPSEVTEINNFYDRAPGGDNADFQQPFDPGAPGVQDANFDQLDDSTFDGSDGSSFDDSGGGSDDV
ncbi:MAG: DUF2076 domain-containing protein [Roseiarcus sp.]